MRSTLRWGFLLAIAAAMALAISACSGPPSADPETGLAWDQGNWDALHWQ